MRRCVAANGTTTFWPDPTDQVAWDVEKMIEYLSGDDPAAKKGLLDPFAMKLRDSLPGRGQSFSQAAKELKAQAGFSDALKIAKLTFHEFVKKFPQHLRVHDGRIFSVGIQATLG